MHIDVRVLSANVMTGIGKSKYFERQLLDCRANFFLLQEAKGRAGTIRSKDFLRFASDGEGQWGTEIWVNRALPLAM